MSSSEGRKSNELTFAYGHESKRVRLRAVGEEKENVFKYVNKRIGKKIALAQLILSAVIGVIQIVTISLVVGEYNYDPAANMGVGIWTSLFVLISAIESLWSLRSPKYWKFHLSFALHIISMLALIILLTFQLGSNLPNLRYELGQVMFADQNSTSGHRYYNYTGKYSQGLLVTSIVLNAVMTLAALVQLVGSFLMTIMTGRAICCGFNKPTGRLFELEIAGSGTKDGGILVVKKGSDSNNSFNKEGNFMRTSSSSSASEEPPSYCTTLAEALS